jgi:N-glycosylase/DNA lyase
VNGGVGEALEELRLEGPFDLDLTLGCGQVFHWVRHGAGYRGAIGAQPFYVEQRGDRLLVPSAQAETARHYFALDHPLEEIYASFPADAPLGAALAVCRGLRIIRQPAWECLATFITSSMKQVTHIAQISHTLRRKYGEPLTIAGETLHAYPTPERLAAAGEAELRACALGYRARNLWKTAQMITEGAVDLEAIRALDDETARAELLKLAGVGVKVANCVLLFAYERLRAFPIDVWIERALRGLYFAGKRRVTAKRLKQFSDTYFGPYGGYAQQYLFHHARTQPRPPRKSAPKKSSTKYTKNTKKT